MKLIDGMKDETLGVALLYYFTKGYQKPVDIKLYDVVLPLLYNEAFSKTVAENKTFLQCLNETLLVQGNFKHLILQAIEDCKETTSKALGVAIIQQMLSFEIVDGGLKGKLLDSNILEFKEAILLGNMLQNKTYDEVVNMIESLGEQYQIVFLDSDTLGEDVDLSILNRFGEVEVLKHIDPSQIPSIIKDKDVVITNKHILSKEQLESAEKLKLICVTATGYNNIDVEYCHQKGIRVCNVKGYSTTTVAQHTFALLLDLFEKNHYYHDYVQSGNYSSSSLFTHFGHRFYDLEGKTWGIVGMGDIGQRVAKIAEVFGCHVQYYSTSGKNNNQPYNQVDFETLCKTSDIISIHAPLNDKTNNLFNASAFALMKSSAYLINVGRGNIVNEEDLAFALKYRKIAGAGLDVFSQEPLFDQNPLLSIQDPTRLIMTPHVAWASVESRKRVIEEVAKNIQAFINGEDRNVC